MFKSFASTHITVAHNIMLYTNNETTDTSGYGQVPMMMCSGNSPVTLQYTHAKPLSSFMTLLVCIKCTSNT